MISPTEIKVLRMRYGLSQRAFGSLLGWGEITIHRYETQKMEPDMAHSQVLIFLKDDKNFRLLYESNKDNLSRFLRTKVEKHMDYSDKLVEVRQPKEVECDICLGRGGLAWSAVTGNPTDNKWIECHECDGTGKVMK